MAFELMTLPFEPTALEPMISEETVNYHYGKHHKGYVDKLNALIAGGKYADATLFDIIKKAKGPTFNNASQVFSHDFYWYGLSTEKTAPSAVLMEKIDHDYGALEDFKEAFLNAAASLFGSGWVWLVNQNGSLAIKKYSNAETPIKDGLRPLLVCDVWEHAYYIDQRNARAAYLENWWQLVNWKFVSDNWAAGEDEPIIGYK
ncbi:MAG TPA: superoxide dismutase [Sulfuricurvum sp.]|nr:superoxide dismutase [Sulfuricurvum sp.]